jgi:histone-lysine N-methyltransferase SETMAR
MDKRDLRLLMNYDFRANLSATECHNRLKAAYPDLKLSYETVREWFSRFRGGDESLEDRQRSGRPATAVTEENVELVRQMIEENPFVTYNGIQQALGIGAQAVETILAQHLHVRKVVAKFVPHSLTQENKEARMEFCRTMRQLFANGESPMVWDILTGDETWIRQKDPHSVNQRQVWCYDDEEPTPEVRPTAWVGKQMVATFFGKAGHLLTVPLQNHRTVTAQWYTDVCLAKVLDAWVERRPNDQFRHLRLHHDNAPAHTSIRTADFLASKSIRTLPHPPYSPDLAPADFFSLATSKENCAVTSSHPQKQQWRPTRERWMKYRRQCGVLRLITGLHGCPHA